MVLRYSFNIRTLEHYLVLDVSLDQLQLQEVLEGLEKGLLEVKPRQFRLLAQKHGYDVVDRGDCALRYTRVRVTRGLLGERKKKILWRHFLILIHASSESNCVQSRASEPSVPRTPNRKSPSTKGLYVLPRILKLLECGSEQILALSRLVL